MLTLFDALAELLTGGWQQAACSAEWPRSACHERFYEASGSVDLMRLRGLMQRRENGALIERMGDAGIELHINADRGPRECSGRVVTIAPDRAEDDPILRDRACVMTPRSGHVDRVAVHSYFRHRKREVCADPHYYDGGTSVVRLRPALLFPGLGYRIAVNGIFTVTMDTADTSRADGGGGGGGW